MIFRTFFRANCDREENLFPTLRGKWNCLIWFVIFFIQVEKRILRGTLWITLKIVLPLSTPKKFFDILQLIQSTVIESNANLPKFPSGFIFVFPNTWICKWQIESARKNTRKTIRTHPVWKSNLHCYTPKSVSSIRQNWRGKDERIGEFSPPLIWEIFFHSVRFRRKYWQSRISLVASSNPKPVTWRWKNDHKHVLPWIFSH